ncbi:hypothetical protein ANCDUO_05827 [Ancylostoma duodenale]|uniref:Uncharacterized protein n=1 Tax=Ancylostoma duodenale TaxID=51022 RepID=A0A0C2GRF2_9BILA|nr:hypothetical protein ANCDUO_05827 [Ancylostoma duodenale]
MSWTPSGVSKMRDKMELADYELVDIKNIRNEEDNEWNLKAPGSPHSFFLDGILEICTNFSRIQLVTGTN